MDILCINQRDDQARVAITRHIPSVFRLAQKTIAVRNSTGFKECCAQAIGNIRYFFSKSRNWRTKNEDESHIDFSDGPDGRALLIKHVIDEHAGDVMDEGLLTRLWPLQEIILSDTIQFVRCERVESDEKPRVATEYEIRNISVIGSSLSSLAQAWSTHGEANDNRWRHRMGFTKYNFVSAFLNLGTAVRRHESIEVMLPNERDIMTHLNSTRETSKPRDFILAIMPQYGFYHAPQNAKQLSFTELFLDCCRQLREVDSGLSPLFLESDHLLDGRVVGPLTIDIPEPKCLGDLVKLFGGPRMRCPERSVVDLQIVEAVLMTEVMKGAAGLLPSPEEMAENSSADEAKMLLPDPRGALEQTEQYLKLATNVLVIHHIVRSIFSSTILWPISHHEMNRELAALPKDAREKRQAIEALHLILSFIDLEESSYENAVRISRYSDIQALLKQTPWEIPIMLAAMISCGLGISGLDWAMENLSVLQLFINEVSYLALAPNSAALHEEVMYFFTEGGDFYGGRDGPMPRQALLTGNPDAEGFSCFVCFRQIPSLRRHGGTEKGKCYPMPANAYFSYGSSNKFSW